MHSSIYEPIRTIKLTKTRDNSAEWFTIDDLYLPYQSEDIDAGGSWYLCYSQSELPEGSQAIRKIKTGQKSHAGHAHVENCSLGWHGLNTSRFTHFM